MTAMYMTCQVKIPIAANACLSWFAICRSLDVEAVMALKRRGVRLNIVNGNPSNRSVLASKAARLQQAHTVVLCGLEDRDPTAADMQVIFDMEADVLAVMMPGEGLG